FLAVRETGYAFSLHQWSALIRHVAEHTRRVADECDGLAGVIKRFEQSNGNGVFGQIPHRAVSTWIKYGVEIFRLYARKLYRISESLLRARILFKTRHRRRLIFRQITLWVERWLAAFRRGQGQIGAGVSKHKVRGCKLFQPETSFAAGVTQLVMRS